MTKPLYGGTRSRYLQAQSIPITLKDLVRKSADTIWKGKSYHKTAISNLCDAVEIMNNPILNNLKTEDIDDYIKVLSEGVKPSTINRKLSNLHTLLKHGFDRGWLEKMPKFTWQAEDNERIRWLSKEEEEKLLALLPPDISAFCEILIHTGMRRDELRTMQRDQIDGEYLRLWKTKTKKARSVPLTPRAKELVEKWVPFNIELSPLRTAWLKAKKQMGLEHDPNFVMHMLRHTTATRLLDTTENIVVVQKMLGHRKIATTMRYAHVSDAALLDAVKRTAQKHSISPVTP